MRTSFATIFKNREFLKIWGAQLISLVCAYMLNFILMGRIYQTTGSSIAVGLLWGFYMIPSVVLGPFVGVFLDYLDKKTILILSSLAQSLVVLLYLGVGQQMWPIYTVVLLYSLCDEFFNPAISVLIPSLVKKRDLAAANSIFLFTVQGSVVLGFLAGGLILKFSRVYNVPFYLASVLLLSAAFLANLLSWDEPPLKKKIKTSLANFWLELARGYKFIKNEPKILFPMILLTGLQIILGMGLILIPSFSKTILLIKFADSPFIVIIPVILGAILGSLMVEKMIRKHLKRVLIINGLFLLGISIFLAGFAPSFFWLPAVLGALLSFLMGVGFLLMSIPLQILIQENTPFDIRGRVFGMLGTLITIAAVLPVLTTVTIVDIFGVKSVLISGGMGLIILAFYAARGKYGILSNYHRS